MLYIVPEKAFVFEASPTILDWDLYKHSLEKMGLEEWVKCFPYFSKLEEYLLTFYDGYWLEE